IGSAVTVDGASIGAITAAADDSITMACSSKATTAPVEMLVHDFEYANAGGADPTAGDRTIGWTLVDGDVITGGGSDTASFTTTVSVASVNSAPVLAGLDLLAIAFEGDVPVAIDPCVDFSDAEGNFNGGTLVVSGVIAEDRIGIDNVGTNPGEISVAGADISYGGTVIGSFTGGEGADLMITFNADATSEAIDTLIESLTYQNLSDNPTLVHFLSITITDAGGATNGFSEVPAVDDPFAGITVTGPASPTFLDLDSDGAAHRL